MQPVIPGRRALARANPNSSMIPGSREERAPE